MGARLSKRSVCGVLLGRFTSAIQDVGVDESSLGRGEVVREGRHPELATRAPSNNFLEHLMRFRLGVAQVRD